MKAIATVLGVAAILLVALFLGVTVADLGFYEFNHPSYPFADAVGALAVIAGAGVFALGIYIVERVIVKQFCPKGDAK